uniref:DDB1- and CUL4-associated factor 11-like n=1 Tax=Myxine glutinosa TaxID=7769 RepID=UPI00358E9C14
MSGILFILTLIIPTPFCPNYIFISALKKHNLRGDTSVMTYRGHGVLHTLIRCRFSPSCSTGQRYIYTGCSTGRVIIYDLLSGRIVHQLHGHSACVRDVHWHPYEPIITTSSATRQASVMGGVRALSL